MDKKMNNIMTLEEYMEVKHKNTRLKTCEHDVMKQIDKEFLSPKYSEMPELIKGEHYQKMTDKEKVSDFIRRKLFDYVMQEKGEQVWKLYGKVIDDEWITKDMRDNAMELQLLPIVDNIVKKLKERDN